MQAMVRVSYLDIVPSDVAEEFADALRSADLTVTTDARPTTPQASVELLVPTAVVVFLASKYLGTILEEAAKDHYGALKSALKRLVGRTTGKKRDVKLTTVGTKGKVLDADPMVLSVYVELRDGRKAKFCFEHTLEESDADRAVAALLDSLSQYQLHGEESPLVAEEPNVVPGDWKPILLRYDAESGAWLVWRWKPPTLDV